MGKLSLDGRMDGLEGYEIMGMQWKREREGREREK